uniref:Carboxylesterase type B domain-containing protein n=1 Tax=Stegastes partitus TaxID=144197 RepID=A0A3B5AR52_9TELE
HPNVDGRFLTKPVDELLHKHELLTVPFMTGVNDDEGGWILAHVGVKCLQKYRLCLMLEYVCSSTCSSFINRCVVHFFKPKDAVKIDMITDEYIRTGEDRVKNRDGLTEMIGDFIFNIPAIKVANGHKDAGATVYLYEYQHPPSFLKKSRPSFVRSDHGDEVFIVFGIYPCPEEEEELSRTVMSYWGNFARTGSPNGDGLAHWPKYGAEEEYLAIGLKDQVVGRALKKDRFVFMTQTLPEKIRQHNENMENGEL